MHGVRNSESRAALTQDPATKTFPTTASDALASLIPALDLSSTRVFEDGTYVVDGWFVSQRLMDHLLDNSSTSAGHVSETIGSSDFVNHEPIHRGLHPSVRLIDPWDGPKPSGCVMEWDGSKYIPECLPQVVSMEEINATSHVEHQYPAPGEEMFEWVDLLEALQVATGSFVFVELGAGYGRWSIRAFNAAMQFGIPPSNVHLITVEAEPLHSEWLMRNFALNEIHCLHTHFSGAISDRTGRGQFYVLQPGELDRVEQARTWYGQALVRSDNRWEGAKTEPVEVGRLTEIVNVLPPDTIIDLIDMDLQGEDSRVLQDSVDVLARTRKIHVGTDSAEEDQRIGEFMASLGWELVRRYLPLRTTQTAYGPIDFVDGVMTWRNPQH